MAVMLNRSRKLGVSIKYEPLCDMRFYAAHTMDIVSLLLFSQVSAAVSMIIAERGDAAAEHKRVHDTRMQHSAVLYTLTVTRS